MQLESLQSAVMQGTINFDLNGRTVRLDTDTERTLLWVLRTDFALTGTKYGCGEGNCRACTVLVDGSAVRSCMTSLAAVAGGSAAMPPHGA